MEINNVQSTQVEALNQTEQVRRQPEPRTEQTAPETSPRSTDAFQVEISAEARSRQQADQAALEKSMQDQQAPTTYNASGQIGG